MKRELEKNDEGYYVFERYLIDSRGIYTAESLEYFRSNGKNLQCTDIPEFEIDNADYIIDIVSGLTIKGFQKNYGTSYNIKHTIENILTKHVQIRKNNYLSNGALIYTMIIHGFNVQLVDEYQSRNCYFNISDKAMKIIIKGE